MATEDAVAEAELALAQHQRLGAESIRAQHEGAGALVQVTDVVPPMGEHDGTREVVLGCLPPIFKQPLLRSRRIVADMHAPA